jgi:hypothetical protein
VKEAQGQLAEAFSWLVPVQMNEDQDFSLGGEKIATTQASLTGRAPQLNAKKQNAGPALAVARKNHKPR